MPARVHRLAARLPQIERPIVIDNVARVPSRVAHLVRFLMLRQPVWLLVRSTDPLELGHVWPYLFLFKRVDVPPFSLAETQAFLAAVDFAGDRRELLAAALRLHRLSTGHPATLAALVAELRCGPMTCAPPKDCVCSHFTPVSPLLRKSSRPGSLSEPQFA